jgi:ketosteroid isomerase-like protein
MRLGEIGENFSLNVTQLVAEGDTVVGLGTCSWNRKGSGEPAEVKIAHVWTLANGKATRFQQHIDTAKERYLIT